MSCMLNNLMNISQKIDLLHINKGITLVIVSQESYYVWKGITYRCKLPNLEGQLFNDNNPDVKGRYENGLSKQDMLLMKELGSYKSPANQVEELYENFLQLDFGSEDEEGDVSVNFDYIFF